MNHPTAVALAIVAILAAVLTMCYRRQIAVLENEIGQTLASLNDVMDQRDALLAKSRRPVSIMR